VSFFNVSAIETFVYLRARPARVVPLGWRLKWLTKGEQSMNDDKLVGELVALAHDIGGPVLGLDTSTSAASLCYVTPLKSQVLEDTQDSNIRASEALSDIILAYKKRCADFNELKAIVVGLGPGSFTGLRVGLALAKGVAMGLACPIYGVSSLLLLAANCGAGPGRVGVLQGHRMAEAYCGIYDINDKGDISQVIPDQAIASNTVDTLTQQHNVTHWLDSADSNTDTSKEVEPRIAWGIRHLADKIRQGSSDNLATLVPHYLRLSEAERKLAYQAKR
jgi:tRNA threonylcarbamoyladenosine biosynthesis protein TsaB